MTKIQLIGLTGRGKIGNYEKQLGNMAILIPMMKLFEEYLPDADIETTIQLTDEFCEAYGIRRIPNPREILPRYNIGLWLSAALFDLFRISLWRYLKDAHDLDLPILVYGGKLRRFASSDIVLDFNGDIFPTDTRIIRVLEHALEIVTIRKLGIPVVEFVSSPGPFDSWPRRVISKFMLDRISVFANREPQSSKLLEQIGIAREKIVNTACPAFLLEPAPTKVAVEILAKEKVDIESRPLIGVTLCGYNLKSQRTWKKPEHFDELSDYVPMLKYLLDELNANVFLLPHVYRVNPYTYVGEHIDGPDHDIALQLFNRVDGAEYTGRLTVIDGKYTPSEAKAVIGQCDMYISGRLHAGVAALSQSVPTVLLAYGHKHRGFASLLRQEKYVYEGQDPQALKALVKDAWKNRREMAAVISRRMSRVEELVDLNFEMVREILSLDRESRDCLSIEKLTDWQERGEQV
jgi:colanic acid/amylovoran biosynthesis protein